MRALTIALAILVAGCARALRDSDGEVVQHSYVGICQGVDLRGNLYDRRAVGELPDDADKPDQGEGQESHDEPVQQ